MVQFYSTIKTRFSGQLSASKLPNLILTLCLILLTSQSFAQEERGIGPITPPPTNDSCSEPGILQVSPNNSCQTSVSASTISAIGQVNIPACNGITNIDDDVWFSFVATSSNHTVTVTPAASAPALKGASLQIFSGTCANLVNKACNISDINNTTAVTLNNTSFIVGQTYFVRVFSAGAGTSYAGNFSICVTTPFCQPAISGSGTPAKWITNVESLGSILDASNSSLQSSYSDFSSVNIASQIPNQPINLKITLNTNEGLSYHLFVDWNRNGIFDTNENVLTTGGTYLGSTTLGFVVPANTLPGKYILRIKTATTPEKNPCSLNGGETEDYSIIVMADCSAKITKVIDGERCGPGEVILKVEATPDATSYNWYYSFGGTTPTPFATTTVPQLVVNLSATTAYKVTANNGNCESRVTSTIRGIIRPLPTITFEPENPVVCGEDNIIKVTANASSNKVVAFEQDFTNSPFGLGANKFVPVALPNPLPWANGTWIIQTSTHLMNYASGWRPAISSGDAGNKFILATSNNSAYKNNEMSTTLETRPFSTVGFENLKLEYRHYFSQNSVVSGKGKVEIKIGDGQWELLHQTVEDAGKPSQFVLASEDLLPYVNEPIVRIRFVYSGKWADGWAIDDVVVSGIKATIPNFTWGSGVSAYTDENATIPYTNQQISTLYIKPSEQQMQIESFTIQAGISIGAGLCEATNTLSVTNKSKTWSPINNSNDWHNDNNWKPLGAPSIENCVIVRSGSAVISNTTPALGKNLVIKTLGKVIVNPKRNLVIKESITTPMLLQSPLLIIEDEASVRQIDNVPNSGTSIIKRKSKPVRRYDYTYWSSMVDNQTLQNLSPTTLFDKYHKWNSLGDSWQTIMSGNATMEAGMGYIVRAPQTYDIVAFNTYPAEFKGRLNNGDYSQPTYENKWALLGNPYPSALSATEFLLANSSVLEGTVYLWAHNSPPSDAYPGDAKYNYTAHDYATFNLSGGTATAPASLDPLTPNITLPNTNVPTGKIASGQSFFVKTLQNGAVNFNNSMRVTGENDQFFKIPTANKIPSRFWLNLRNNQGAFNQILVGYLKEATTGLDWGYDGEVFGGAYLSMYTICENVNLSIQARPLPFDNRDIIPVGYTTMVGGELFISLENVEGVFETLGQSIYLKDNIMGQFKNLKNGPYYFNTQVGTFDGRFELHFRPDGPERKGEKIIIDDNADILAYKTSSEIIVESKDCNIEEIEILDIQGRIIKSFKHLNIAYKSISGLTETQQVLILKVKTTEGKQFTKRVIF